MKPQIKEEQKNGTTPANIPDVKAPIKAPEKQEQRKTEPKLSIEDKIIKVEELRSLTGKRQRTLNTLHQLRAFHFASDDSCHLTIADSQGQKFQTGNSTLITMLRSYLEAVLNEKVSALDDEILDFKI